MTEQDRDLRERFASLRTEEERTVPPFVDVLARAGGGANERRGVLRPVLAGLAASALAALVLYLRGSAPAHSPSGTLPTLESWRAPTDFLLDTPGRELLQQIPSLGRDLPGTSAEPPQASPSTERSTSS